MRKFAAIVFVLAALLSLSSKANNINVTNVILLGQNTVNKSTLIKFDISWNNSWRVNVGPSNWDAAWVFAKFRKKNAQNWNHATLNWVNGAGTADGHTVPTGSVISSSNDNGAGGSRGVFIYGDTAFTQQSVNYSGVQLRWNYGVDLVNDEDSIELCVMAFEMVYVPQGSFYLGDGNPTIIGQFRAQATNTPFQVTSESAITLGGSAATSLLNNNATGMVTPDDFNTTTSQSLPASFPKGFGAFYVMKYEISQEQYVEFLNKLTRTQQAQRFLSVVVGNYMWSGSGATIPQNRNGIRLISDPGGLLSRVYGNDLNNNNFPGEATDGQNIACNWLSSVDLLAFLDWSGLRPLTELEYEKACRGNQVPFSGEYAWGGINILAASGISNPGANNEVANNYASNCVYNNTGGVNGPMRVGNFAQSATNREQAGAGYYGIMELTGNVWEDVVLVGSVAGRSFTGIHGNGALNANGQADVNFWPGINGNNTTSTINGTYNGVTGCTGFAGISFTGGTWNNISWLTVSDRNYRGAGFSGITVRDTRNGGRGARLAP